MYLENDRKARFPFGYGLTYTNFEYSELCVQKMSGAYDYNVSLRVKNVGSAEAAEVVQLYLQDIYSSVVTPDKLLKGFARIDLKPGEKRKVTFKLGFESFRLMNKDYEWVVEPGDFRIMAGASSEDIRLETIIKVC